VTPVSVAKLARTAVAPSQAAASPVQSQDNGSTSVLLYIMGAALLGALVLGAVVLGLWLRQKGAWGGPDQ
jgi:hypothetical protein